MRCVAIMQPTYLPWIGYFSLIDQVDEFIFLDSVQFSKRSWQQRNKIKTINGPVWLTIPVLSKGKRGQFISEVEIDRARNFPISHITSITHNYTKASFFSDYSQELFSILENNKNTLSILNIELIKWFCKVLKIVTPFKLSSKLDINESKADLLAIVCVQVKATEYLSPLGSKEYMDESEAFSIRNINVKYQDYTHPKYSQLFGEFESHMSILDLLFNHGPDSMEIIRDGYS